MPPRRAAATFDALVPAVVLARRPSSSFLRRTHARSRAWIRFSHLAHAHSLIRFHPLSHSPVPRIVSIPPPLPLSIPRPKDQIVRSCEGSEWGGREKSVIRLFSAKIGRLRRYVPVPRNRICVSRECITVIGPLEGASAKGSAGGKSVSGALPPTRVRFHASSCLLWTTCAAGVAARGCPLPCEITLDDK